LYCIVSMRNIIASKLRPVSVSAVGSFKTFAWQSWQTPGCRAVTQMECGMSGQPFR
jgi:hypothetical protein